jgi:hypothetical protein
MVKIRISQVQDNQALMLDKVEHRSLIRTDHLVRMLDKVRLRSLIRTDHLVHILDKVKRHLHTVTDHLVRMLEQVRLLLLDGMVLYNNLGRTLQLRVNNIIRSMIPPFKGLFGVPFFMYINTSTNYHYRITCEKVYNSTRSQGSP